MLVFDRGVIKELASTPATCGRVTQPVNIIPNQSGNPLQTMQMFMQPVRAMGSVYIYGLYSGLGDYQTERWKGARIGNLMTACKSS